MPAQCRARVNSLVIVSLRSPRSECELLCLSYISGCFLRAHGLRKRVFRFQEHAAIHHVSSTGYLTVPAVANDAVERLRVGLEGVAHRSAETATGQCFCHSFFFEYYVVSREKTRNYCCTVEDLMC